MKKLIDINHVSGGRLVNITDVIKVVTGQGDIVHKLYHIGTFTLLPGQPGEQVFTSEFQGFKGFKAAVNAQNGNS